MPINLVQSSDTLYVHFPKSNRLLWTTDTDWNKGTLGSDVEVVGTGSSAQIAPKTTLVSGTEIYLNWRLNETTGTTAADSAYYNRPGTLVTPEGYSPAQWVAGKLNNALSNAGEAESSCYVEGGDVAGFEWNEPFSVECWFNQTAGYDVSLIGNYSSGDGKGWSVAIQEGYIRFILHGGGTNYLQTYTTTTVTPGTYQHLVITYDGSGVDAGVKFYLDGVLLTNSVLYDGLAETSIIPATNNFRVGAILDTAWGWIGQLDEVNLYTVVLSQANVDSRYNSGDGTETPLFTQNTYPTTASYTTNIADSARVNQLWDEFNFMRTTPSGTTVTVKCRVSNDANAMGSYGSSLTAGQNLGLTGQFIQFSVDFTGTTTQRAAVDYLSTLFTAETLTDIVP